MLIKTSQNINLEPFVDDKTINLEPFVDDET